MELTTTGAARATGAEIAAAARRLIPPDFGDGAAVARACAVAAAEWCGPTPALVARVVTAGAVLAGLSGARRRPGRPTRVAGSPLAELRVGAGLTLDAAGARVGVGGVSVCRWEHGRVPLDLRRVPLVAAAYGVSEAAVLGAALESFRASLPVAE